MKVFAYTTKRGTEVEMIIKNSKDVVAVIKNKGTFKVFTESINYDREQDNCISLKIDKTGNNGKDIYINITDEIYKYIKELKEEERIDSLPQKQRIKAKINRLKAKINFTYFVDADLVTGMKYYALTQRVDKRIWSKIKKYFTYIDTSYHSDNFDAMYGSNFKGYLTNAPEKVEKILHKEIDLSNIKEELEKLEKELELLEHKEESDNKYRKELIEGEINKAIEEFLLFKEGLRKIPLGNGEHKSLLELDINAYVILDMLVGDFNKEAKARTYNPEEIKKVTSCIYAGGYVYWEKDNIAVIPTEKHIVVMSKNTYSKEWWNSWNGVSINGFFAPYGLGDITIYPKKDGILRVLEKFGYTAKTYYEVSYWFIVAKNFTNWNDDICNIITLSDDYNYLESKEKVLDLYKNEKRWEWKGDKYPAIENIKYIGKFRKIEE